LEALDAATKEETKPIVAEESSAVKTEEPPNFNGPGVAKKGNQPVALADIAMREQKQLKNNECPFCERGKFVKKRTCGAYLFFFPFGFYCCIAKKWCVQGK